MSVWKVSNTLVPYSKHILQQYLETAFQDIYTTKQLRLLICQHKDHAPIGTIDLFDFDPMHARIGVGILIFEQFRNQGYAYQTIELVKQYALDTLMVKQIYCNISAVNKESIALFEKCRFQKIGIKKMWNKIGPDCYEDEIMFQFLQPSAPASN